MFGQAKYSSEHMMQPVRLDRADRWIYLFGFLIVNFALAPLFREGHIVFSDIAIGTSAERYLEEIIGVWNQRWSTANFFNLSRLLFVAPFYAITQLTGGSGSTLVKLLIFALVNLAWGSFLILSRSILTQIAHSKTGDARVIAFACTVGALFYALNPWLLTRIQHLYLLCGYALFPLVIFSAMQLFSLRSRRESLISGWTISFDTLLRAALFALVFSIACASVHYAIYMLPVLAIVLIHSSLNVQKHCLSSVVLQQSIRLALAISLFVIISFHWISPFVVAYLEGYTPGQNNVNVPETIVMFSRNSDWLNTVTGISYWWPMFSLEELPNSFRIAQMTLLGVILLGSIHWFKTSSKVLVIGAVIVSIAATGAHYIQIAPWYVGFVLSDNNPLGFIFRDPNKLVGPLLLALSIFLSAGVLLFIQILIRSFPQQYKAIPHIILLIALFFYLAPFWQNYVLGFYAPVLVPIESSQTQKELLERVPETGRVLYLPSADNMLQSGLGYSSLDWNNANINGRSVAKAIGSFTIFNSLVDTLYQHEGAPLSVDYFLNYLQDLMDKGSTRNLGALIALTGATHVVYQSDYAGQHKRHAFNLDVLKNQEDLKLEYENHTFAVFALTDPQPRLSELNAVIHTPYGMNRLTLFKTMGQPVLDNADVQFVSATPTFNPDSIRRGDFMEVRKFEDWLLSGLQPASILYPFAQVNEGNPFLKWSKTFLSGQEWQYYLKRENISNFPFDFDYSQGIVFSAAPARLNVAPYDLASLSGDEVLTALFLADGPPVFRSLEPDTLKIKIEPKTTHPSLLNIIGEYTVTAPSDSVIAVESRGIPVNEATPYRLSFNLDTDDNSSSVQIQVVFMDDSGRKIGSEYVASSDTSKRMHNVIPVGFAFITPLKTAQMKIEFLARKLKRTRAEWSVEALSLQSLSQYSGPNIITLDAKQFSGKSGQLYIRLFKSKAGGEIQITSNGISKNIDTYDPNLSTFEWVDAGHFSFSADPRNPEHQNSNQHLELNNKRGFNAVNALALIDDETRLNREKILQKQFEKSRLFLSLDAEADFASVGKQTDQRIYADLHDGKGFRSSGGELRSNFDIVKSSVYALSIQAAIDPRAPRPEVSIIDRDSGVSVWSEALIPMEDSRPLDLYSDNAQGDWEKRFTHSTQSNDMLGRWQSRELNLDKGQYTLLIRLPEIQFSPLRWVQTQALDAQETLYAKINGLEGNRPDNWSTVSSVRVSVEPEQQQLLKMNFSSTKMKDLHLKIKYLDSKEKEISVEYVNHPEWKQANGDFRVSQVVTAPDGAQWTEIQILGKQVEPESRLDLRSSSLTDYAILPLIDWVLINEASSIPATSLRTKRHSVEYSKVGAGLYEIQSQSASGGIKLLESPSILWQLETDGDCIKPFTVNGLSNAYRFRKLSADPVIRYLPEKIHRLGLYLLGFCLLMITVLLAMHRYKRK